jgi:cytochrome P450
MGSSVVVSQVATRRHPQFGNDAAAFDPARLTGTGSTSGIRTRTSRSAAARACIGSQFAMLEVVIALAVLLQRFRIRSDQEDMLLETEGITLRPTDAVAPRLHA